MRPVVISALTAAVVCVLAFMLEDRLDPDDEDEASAATPQASAPSAGGARLTGVDPIDSASLSEADRGLVLNVTVEPTEDSWVSGARSPGADDRMLSDADHSICFLTKIEISGFQSAEDRGACRIEVDDFTGFWKVVADVPEGSRSEIRCNARCMTWE